MTPFLSGTTCISAPADRSCSWQVATPLHASQSSCMVVVAVVACIEHEAPFLAVAFLAALQSCPPMPAVMKELLASWPQPEIDAVIVEAFAPWLHPENEAVVADALAPSCAQPPVIEAVVAEIFEASCGQPVIDAVVAEVAEE